MDNKLHLAHYNRYLWERPNLIVVTGEAREIWEGQDAYRGRYSIPPAEPYGEALLGRFFAAAGLAAVSLPEGGSWGWSVTFPGSPVGLFCGIEPEGSICGRVFAGDRDRNLVVVQKQSRNTAMMQSHFALTTHEPIEVVERYFEVAEQTLIRIALNVDGRGALLLPMPGGHFEDIGGLSDEALIEQCFSMADRGLLKKLAETLLFYECPCNQERIDNMIMNLPRDQRETLWDDLPYLEVHCPRCGRSYRSEKR